MRQVVFRAPEPSMNVHHDGKRTAGLRDTELAELKAIIAVRKANVRGRRLGSKDVIRHPEILTRNCFSRIEPLSPQAGEVRHRNPSLQRVCFRCPMFSYSPASGGQVRNPQSQTLEQKENYDMFARVLEFTPKMEKKEEFIRVIKNEVLPILKKQTGFLEILPFFPEVTTEKALTISLWADKKNAEKYEREWFPKVQEILKPYLVT